MAARIPVAHAKARRGTPTSPETATKTWLALGPIAGTESADDRIAFEGGYGFGQQVDLAPDIDGDGGADLVISEIGRTSDSIGDYAVHVFLSSDLF